LEGQPNIRLEFTRVARPTRKRGDDVATDVDDKFYERADAHIHLSNDQAKDIGRGTVSASMMFATARFNAWVSACGFNSRGDMAAARQETVEYYVKQYRLMLEENMDDYIGHFNKYMAVDDAPEA
jgi:hypothetical protein